jgi:hypothetical protein
MYHSSKFARERDKIRQAVLEGLGWKILRLWSTDWWTDKRRATETLHAELERLLAADRASTKVVSPSAEGPVAPAVKGDDQLLQEAEDDASHRSAPKEAPAGPRSASPECTYRSATLKANEYRPNPENFYQPEYTARLVKMIEHVIDCEGPIHADMLTRKIARHHGFARTGNQIEERVLSIAKRSRQAKAEGDAQFFWPADRIVGSVPNPRYAGRDGDLRKPEYICKEELRAINDALLLFGDANEVARVLGISRLSNQARERIHLAIG